MLGVLVSAFAADALEVFGAGAIRIGVSGLSVALLVLDGAVMDGTDIVWACNVADACTKLDVVVVLTCSVPDTGAVLTVGSVLWASPLLDRSVACSGVGDVESGRSINHINHETNSNRA